MTVSLAFDTGLFFRVESDEWDGLVLAQQIPTGRVGSISAEPVCASFASIKVVLWTPGSGSPCMTARSGCADGPVMGQNAVTGGLFAVMGRGPESKTRGNRKAAPLRVLGFPLWVGAMSGKQGCYGTRNGESGTVG